MLNLKPYEIESYLREKGLAFRRRGSKAECKTCPFCGGGEHSDHWTFVVYLDESGGNFKCMRGSCSQSGSFWQLAEHFGDDPKDFYTQREAKRAERFNKTEPEIVAELKPNLSFTAEKVEPQKLTDEAKKYLTARGFSEEVLNEIAIWCDEKGLINFGYYHEGELCFVKVRHPRKPLEKEPKAWAKWKGGLRTLYGIEQCDLSKPYIVITFGEYDRIALQQSRIENAVSVPSGDTDLEWINVCFEKLKSFSEIILWIDNDEAGKLALPKIAARLGAHKIKVVDTAFKDANEMLLKRGRKIGFELAEQEIFEVVALAKWYYKGDVMQFCDIEESETSFEGFQTGIDILDKNLGGILEGRLTVHTGDTKAGKSTAVNQIVMTAIEQGAIACVWSGEDELSDYKYKTHVHVAGYEGVEIKTSKAGADYAVVSDEFKQKVNDWAFNRLYVLSRKSLLTEDNLIANFRLAFERFGCNVFVVDNLMKLVAAKDTQNLNFRQTQVVNKLSDFAKETNTHIHLVTHTSKADNENTPPESIRDVSGAKEIVNLCDSLVSWWRVPDDKKSDYDNADTICAILANRVFPNKERAGLMFDWRIKRFASNAEQLRDARYKI
jgi:twinkle protein